MALNFNEALETILKAAGIEEPVEKYSSSQPRHPAGSSKGGEFASKGGRGAGRGGSAGRGKGGSSSKSKAGGGGEARMPNYHTLVGERLRAFGESEFSAYGVRYKSKEVKGKQAVIMHYSTSLSENNNVHRDKAGKFGVSASESRPRGGPKGRKPIGESKLFDNADDAISYAESLIRGVNKSDDEVDFEEKMPFSITKTDDEKRIVYGFASVSKMGDVEVEDRQNDVCDMAELTQAAHQFMIESRDGGEMHSKMGTGVIVESMILDADVKKSLGITMEEEGWYIGYKIHDEEVWSKVKDGTYGAFSIGGSGVRVPE